jgi:hypothetical protein
LTINTLIPQDSYLYKLNLVFTLASKPFTVGSILFLIYVKKNRLKVDILEKFLILMLFYQVCLLTEVVFNSFTYSNFDIDITTKMADNNTGDNIPRGNNNNNNQDIPIILRYLSGNIAALIAKRSMTRAIGLAIANGGNIIADVLSNEEKANFAIDEFNFFRENGRLRGGHPGSGPFERGFGPETNPFEKPEILDKPDASNLLPEFSFITDLFTPVQHAVPLETLINVHLVSTIGLFVLAFCLILLIIYFYINLIIIFNKDYLLSRIKNKYAVMYLKYVIFKSRVDIAVLGIFILGVPCFMLYTLHYLIIHPIIVNT